MSRNDGKRPQMEAKPLASTRRLRGGPSAAAAAHDVDEEEFPATGVQGGRSSTSSSSTSRSPASSCVSSEGEQNKSSSPEAAAAATSMVLAGCPRCLLYVMLAEEDPKCPKCKSTVLLDFQHGNASKTTNIAKKKNKKA
ncbi:hypothetical protein Cni_G12229 [Canna indica]|uniref:GIR1-like zinc ribbon domain-containing protein n=1 Tax=Canna indica TaxID=4628 RepID=A0AAQ3QAD0_9LILI|nr:hypothetical protein Cni_G12229 [Canna indica]